MRQTWNPSWINTRSKRWISSAPRRNSSLYPSEALALGHIWTRWPFLLRSSTNNTRPKLIMTTEDPQVFNNSLAYQRNASFPFEFLVNENDNMQGFGYPRHFRGEGESTIVSSLTALKFHFNAGRVYLNCCSNFHAVLNRLLQGQCGARRHRHDFVFGKNISEESVGQLWPTQVAQCMNQESIPRRFRICCGWSKDSACKEMMKNYFEEKKGNKTSTWIVWNLSIGMGFLRIDRKDGASFWRLQMTESTKIKTIELLSIVKFKLLLFFLQFCYFIM